MLLSVGDLYLFALLHCFLLLLTCVCVRESIRVHLNVGVLAREKSHARVRANVH